MKIGILTFNRAYNYGAVLQCYSLQETLREMGHDAWVINYLQPHIERSYKPIIWRSWLSSAAHLHLRGARNTLRNYPPRNKKKQDFEAFTSKYLHCTAPCDHEHIPQDFDAYVIGSDQVWNQNCLGGRIDNTYTAHFPRKPESQMIGYAIGASMATLEAMGDKLPQIISRFNAFSVREELAAKVIACMTDGTRPRVCCDPALLHDADFWTKITNNKFKTRKYVLVYNLRYPQSLRPKIAALAQKLNCEIIDASPMQYPVDNFVSLFKYARYVITTSFHGTAFSLIFGKPFYSVKLHDGWDTRYTNILHALHADHCCAELDFQPDPTRKELEPEVVRNLKEYRKPSLQFLKEALPAPTSPR